MRPEPPPPAAIQRRRTTEDTRTYRFLTYVMGGGVQVKKHVKLRDEVTPVRAASIRGQLRFWWRVCNPSGCKNLEELRQREGDIWGATSQPSKVVVDVLEQPGEPTRVQVYKYPNGKKRTSPVREMRDDVAYGAFPLQPDKDAQKAEEAPGVLFDYRSKPFRIRFSYPDNLKADVTAALWAWETFGGLGARTRRGFGAIARAEGQQPSLAQIQEALQTFRSSLRISGVPSLANARLGVTKTPPKDSVSAWKEVLHLFSDSPAGGEHRPKRGPGRQARRQKPLAGA